MGWRANALDLLITQSTLNFLICFHSIPFPVKSDFHKAIRSQFDVNNKYFNNSQHLLSNISWKLFLFKVEKLRHPI